MTLYDLSCIIGPSYTSGILLCLIQFHVICIIIQLCLNDGSNTRYPYFLYFYVECYNSAKVALTWTLAASSRDLLQQFYRLIKGQSKRA